MKTAVFFSILAVSLCCAHGQSDMKAWTRLPGSSGDDEGYAVTVDNAGNAIVAGGTTGSMQGGNAGRYDMWVTKYNPAGTQLWVRQRGSAQREFAYGVATDPTGNIYTAGYAGAALEVTNGFGGFDVFVMKHDSAGTYQWTRQFGFGNDDEGRAIACDRFGNIFVTGYVRGAFAGIPRPGSADVFVRKYDSAGAVGWTAVIGSADVDESFGITCDLDGNVFVTGWCSGTVDGVTPYLGNGDNFLAKYSPTGTRLWIKQWGTVNKDTGYAVATDAAGNVYVSGYTTGTLYSSQRLGERDIFFAKYSSAGNFIWGQQLATSGHDEGWGIAATPAGDVFVGGKVSGNLNAYDWQGGEDVILNRFDSAGNWRETFQYGTIYNDLARGVAVYTNGDVYIAGTTYTNLDGQPYLGGRGDGFVSRFVFSSNALPCAPRALAATAAMSNAFTANWNVPLGAVGCRLDVSTNFSFADFVPGYQDLDAATATNFNVTGLNPTVMYFYRLRAYNTNGTSSNSITMDVTLAPAGPCYGIVNSDFESGFSFAGADFVANGWSVWESAPGVVAATNETTVVHGGANAQRITVTGASGAEGGVYQRINVTASNSYTVSVWISAGDPLASCYLGVDPSGNTNASNITWSTAATSVSWVQRTWTGTATAHAITVYYRVVSDGVARTGNFDDAAPGDLALPAPLGAYYNGSQLMLSWPQCKVGHLERTENLSSPAWVTDTNQVSIVGGQNTVTLPPTESSTFFRLVED